MNLIDAARTLPHPWRSIILGTTAGAQIKLIRMDDAGIPYESHGDYDEALLVLEGYLQLDIEGEVINLHHGDFHLVPAGKSHRVLPGSRGTLLLVDAAEPIGADPCA